MLKLPAPSTPTPSPSHDPRRTAIREIEFQRRIYLQALEELARVAASGRYEWVGQFGVGSGDLTRRMADDGLTVVAFDHRSDMLDPFRADPRIAEILCRSDQPVPGDALKHVDLMVSLFGFHRLPRVEHHRRIKRWVEQSRCGAAAIGGFGFASMADWLELGQPRLLPPGCDNYIFGDRSTSWFSCWDIDARWYPLSSYSGVLICERR